MSIASESFRLDTSAPNLFGLEYTSLSRTAVGLVDSQRTVWFERASAPEVIAIVSALIGVEQAPRRRVRRGADDISLYLNGPDPDPYLNIENKRTATAPHGGFQWIAMSRSLANRFIEDLSSLVTPGPCGPPPGDATTAVDTAYLGRRYGTSTDWTSVIRDAASCPFGPSWLRCDLDVASGLADLAEKLKGTPSEHLLAEAALSIVEHGTTAERSAAWQLPWEHGARAMARLRRIVEEDRERTIELRGVANVIWRLLQAYPNDPDVRAMLHVEAAREPLDPWLAEMEATVGGSTV